MTPAGAFALPGAERRGRTLPRALALLLISLLALTGLAAGATSASAALPSGISPSSAFSPDVKHNGVQVVDNNTEVTLGFLYTDQVQPGQVVDLEFPEGFDFGAVPSIPAVNADDIASITLVGTNTVRVTFKNPLAVSGQKTFYVKGKVDATDRTTVKDFEWKLGGEPQTTEIVHKTEGDTFAPSGTEATKALSGVSLGDVATVANGVVTINQAALFAKTFNYTLKVRVRTDVPGYAISDQLPAGMTYVSGSFTEQLTQWDANGFNRAVGAATVLTPTISGTSANGQSFSTTKALTGVSEYVVKYQAKFTDAAQIAALQTKLQAAYDAVDPITGGSATVPLTNKVDLNGTEKSATANISVTRVGVRKPNPGVGDGKIDKSTTFPTPTIVTPAEGGALTPALPITYQIKGNLNAFTPPANLRPDEVPFWNLTKNIVISDTLPAQQSWNTSAAGFFTGTGITQAATCPASVDAFTGDAFVNQWCVSGQRLMVNIGKNPTTAYDFQVKATINNVEGLTAFTPANLPHGTGWNIDNRATLNWSTTPEPNKTASDTTRVKLHDRGDGSNGYNDTDVFTKSADDKITVTPGEAARIKYTFTVNPPKDGAFNPADVTIVDKVDPNIFELPANVSDLKSDTVVTYDGQPVAASDYTITKNAAGDLLIALTPAKAAAVAADKTLKVDLTLTTRVLRGTQSLVVNNRADLMGTGSETLYWSEQTTQATSFGDVAEIRKSVRDTPKTEWTQNLRADLNPDETLKNDTYVYAVEYIPHGDFGQIPVTVGDVNDVIQDGSTFLGFVDAADVDKANVGALANKNTRPIGGNLEAVWDAGTNTVTLRQKAGEKLDPTQKIVAYFAVRITSFTPDVPVVNLVPGSSTAITPTDGYPLAVAKVDAKNPNKTISDPDARFTLSGPDGVIANDIFVRDGLLMRTVDGVVKGLKVTEPGTYKITEQIPPTGYVRSEEVLTIVVRTDEIPNRQVFVNDPIGAHVKVGDYVWIDKNHDGLQDGTDKVVPGVELKIQHVDKDGVRTDVTGVNNMPVPNETTGADGKYLFDLLPVLKTDEKYEVTIVDTPDMLDGHLPTTPGANGGAGDKDSSTDSALTVLDLTVGGKKDLTLDFGFVKPYVLVGDYVWIDVNKDGLQDDTDVKLKGVKLAIFGPDGKTPVTEDVYGDPIVDQVTDENGYYVFDNLPVLTDATKSYTVKIVQDDAGTIAALKGLAPTKDDVEDADKADDSSTWTSTSWKDLSKHKAEDLTLDFGFIRLAVSVGDYVWVDTDRDGLQGDPAVEPGIGDVLLEVYGPDGVKVTKDVDGNDLPIVRTTSEGKYSFDNLPALEKATDSYTVKIVQTDPRTVTALKPYVPTTPGPNGGEGDKDSSTWESKSTIDLTKEGSRDPSLDFGFVKKYVSVGDYVWIDLDRDGLQDESDIPVKDVTLKLVKVAGDVVTEVTDVKGNKVAPTQTDADGWYEFSLLPVLAAGETYRVEIDRDNLPAALDNFIPTQPLAGDDTDVDSEDWKATNVKALDGTAVPAKPKDSAHVGVDPSLDFGFVEKRVSVGDTVWYDKDEDGFRDEGEEPLEGVTLNLVGPDGKPVTDVFGDPVVPTVTDENGRYTFDNLPALPEGKHYTVIVDYEKSPILKELDLVPTNPGNRGEDDNLEHDFSHTDEATSGDLTNDGDRDPTLDFGFRKAKVSVGDYVWIDVNRDGLQDSSDIAIAGVVLKLTGPDGQPVLDVFGNEVAPVTTDAKGYYVFKDLPVLHTGTYTVTIDREKSQNALKGLIPTKAGVGSDRTKDSSTWTTSSIADLSTDKAHDPSLDFGFVRPRVSVGDYVWLDTNKDGLQNKSEKGIEGVLMVLTGPDGKPVVDVDGKPVRPVRTDKFGHYTFENLPVLPEGQHYTVRIDKDRSKKALKGLNPTKPGVGTNRGKDSSTKKAVSIADLSKDGMRDPSLDFGFVNPKVSGDDEENNGNKGNGNNGAGNNPGNGNNSGNGALPGVGATFGPWAIAAGLFALLAGFGLMAARRRNA